MTEFHASDTVGGYRLEARLGGGGFGTVWRARRAADNQLVALKLLPDAAGADDLRLRADVELLAASAAAGSPHVVRVLDGGVDPVPYVAMEYITGVTLADELRQRQRLPQLEVIEIGLAIADALKALNAAGIVHRDVKPSNVMIDRTGVIKLTDFGIAKIAGFDAVTLTGQLPLSIAYAAPEVWEGRAEHRSDLYALAIMLYQCLTGILPFRGAYAELFYQHRTKEPDLSPLPADLAPSLHLLIRNCLEKSPADRPDDAEACITLMQQASQEVAAPAGHTPVHTREPEHFGPWHKGEPVAGQPWAWHCRHETTGEEAIVEVRFAASVAYGEALRRAVAANERMAPHGAERLLGTNRLILRPNEAWRDPPEGAFQSWVAREVLELPPSPSQVSPRMALRAVECLTALAEVADEEGLPLQLGNGELSMLPDGSLHLAHPGFPSPGSGEPEKQALAYLKSLPLTREVRASITRAASLNEARRAIALLTSMRQIDAPEVEREMTRPAMEPAPPLRPPAGPAGGPGKTPWLALIGGAVVAGVVAAVAAILAFSSGNNDNNTPLVIATETAAPTPDNPAVAKCVALPLPAVAVAAEEACRDVATAYAFDPSCPRGQVCNRKRSGDAVSFGFNDRAVAFIDASGNLAVAREDGSESVVMPNTSRAQQPAWSPDGRYLAYLVVSTVEPPQQPSPQATPQPGPPPPQGPFYSTQLRVIEVDRPANHAVVMATNSLPNTPGWLQRFAAWPQWSPDGKTLFYLSLPANQAGGQLYGVELPVRATSEIDFSQLRSGLPAAETLVPPRLVTLALTGADFGQQQAYLGRFTVRPNGEIYVQVCEGERARMSCGLGRWNGRPSSVVAITRDRVVEPPVAGPDALYAYVKEPNGSGGLIRIGLDGVAAQTEVRLQPPGDPADGAWFAMRPQIAVSRHGDALLAATGNGNLGGIALADGVTTPWRAGSSPAWFVAARPADVVSLPQAVAFTTPTPEPSPSVTPTPTQGPRRSMTINVTARRGNTPQQGVTVVAMVEGNECAKGTTDSLGRMTLTVPQTPGAAAVCSQPNATIRFLVNGTLVQQTLSFTPLAVSGLDVTLQ